MFDQLTLNQLKSIAEQNTITMLHLYDISAQRIGKNTEDQLKTLKQLQLCDYSEFQQKQIQVKEYIIYILITHYNYTIKNNDDYQTFLKIQ
tara:strand:+ start:610 stop:882 length:273 start_codon:yes stop_codon:yes gene_type:complete